VIFLRNIQSKLKTILTVAVYLNTFSRFSRNFEVVVVALFCRFVTVLIVRIWVE